MKMNTSGQSTSAVQFKKPNQNIQVYVRVRPMNSREKCMRSAEIVDVVTSKEIITRHTLESKLTKKFTFDRAFGPDSRQVDVYKSVVAPLIDEVLCGYNCTVFAYGQTGTGKTHTMVGNECAELKSSWEDDSDIGIIPRALSHLFDELRLMELEFSMRISYLEIYNEELCDLLSSDDTTKIRIFDDSTKKGSVIIQGLEEIPVHSKDDVYKLLEKGKERRKTATTLMNAQSSRSHTVFSIVVHIKENGMDGEEMLKIGKLNLVDLAGSENVSKAGNEKGIRVRETVNINQSLLTLGRCITALVEKTPHIPYRESKLTRLLQESLGGRTKTSIIATISPGHKDIEETLSTLDYAHRAKNIQNKPEVNQKLTKKTVLKEYTEEIDKLKRDLVAARDKNGIYLAEETYNEMTLKMDSQNRELNEKVLLLKALKDELSNKENIFNEVSLNLVEKTEELKKTEKNLIQTKGALLGTKKVLHSTKRRYKEKKVLLETHMKTEEELMTQASKIMEVANLATQDTEVLHSIIDRRKDVDVKIQTAVERFSERMMDNFELMDDNLKDLQTRQKNFVHNVQEEIANGSSLQTQLLENSVKQLKSLHELWFRNANNSNDLDEKFTKCLNDFNDEHKTIVLKYIAELKENDLVFKEQVKDNISILESYNEQQKSSLDSMRDSILEKFKTQHKELQDYTKQVQEFFNYLKQDSTENLDELKQITVSIEEEKKIAEEEQKLIEQFQKQMQSIHIKRKGLSDNTTNRVQRLEFKIQDAINKLDKNVKLSLDYTNKNLIGSQSNCELVDELKSNVELSVDQSVAKCSTVAIQLENRQKETLSHLQKLTEQQEKYHQFCQSSSIEHQNKTKRIRLDNIEKSEKDIENITITLADNTNRVKNHLSIAASLNDTSQNSIRDYSQIYKEQMTVCVGDLETFKKTELKTYSATGSTPSKKEFIYPRVLVATSPHNQIIKRFRQENNWSDLDTTIPIDEETESDDGVASIANNSITEISDTETLFNSTPVETEVMPPKRGSGSITQCTSNSLKPSCNSNRSNSLIPPSTSPRKPNSRTSSPSFQKENKENVQK